MKTPIKDAVAFALTGLAVFFLLPCFALFGGITCTAPDIDSPSSPSFQPPEQTKEGFSVYISELDEVKTYTEKEYLLGVVAAEISPEYPDEAIKAQIVASYTFALRRKQLRADAPDESIKNADISDDPSLDQGFIPPDELSSKWGAGTDAYTEKISALIDSVKEVRVMYGGELANTVYHAISPGKTVSCEEVWGESVPYLVPVESISDLLCDRYLSVCEVASQDFIDLLSQNGASADGDKAALIGETTYSPSGTVTQCVLGSKAFSGSEIRKLFSLRSAAFDISYDAERDLFIFTVRGYGHGVGMSQNGARAMAEQGMMYDEILLWYYTGCTVG